MVDFDLHISLLGRENEADTVIPSTHNHTASQTQRRIKDRPRMALVFTYERSSPRIPCPQRLVYGSGDDEMCFW